MNLIGEIAALAAAFMWAGSSFIFTAASIKIGPIQLNVDRMILAGVLLCLSLLVTGIGFAISTEQLVYLSLSGFVGLVLGDSFLFRSFKEIGPRVSMLLLSSNPALAAVLAYLFLDEGLNLTGILGISVTLFGIAIVILEKPKVPNGGFNITLKGVIFGFLSAAGQGSGLIFAKLAFQSGDIHSITATFYRIITAVIILMPLAAFANRYKNPFKLYIESRKTFLNVFAGSFIGPYLGITLFFVAIIYTKVCIASTIMATVPIIMLPLSAIIYTEKLTLRAIIGAFIAFGGVAVLFLI
ncbi:MAG: DMT family transporter [Bacteroidota bacterium]